MLIVKLSKEGTKTKDAIHDINIQLNLGLTKEEESKTSLKDLGFSKGYYNAVNHSLELYR